jgi:hypothetical protein
MKKILLFICSINLVVLFIGCTDNVKVEDRFQHEIDRCLSAYNNYLTDEAYLDSVLQCIDFIECLVGQKGSYELGYVGLYYDAPKSLETDILMWKSSFDDLAIAEATYRKKKDSCATSKAYEVD